MSHLACMNCSKRVATEELLVFGVSLTKSGLVDAFRFVICVAGSDVLFGVRTPCLHLVNASLDCDSWMRCEGERQSTAEAREHGNENQQCEEADRIAIQSFAAAIYCSFKKCRVLSRQNAGLVN